MLDVSFSSPDQAGARVEALEGKWMLILIGGNIPNLVAAAALEPLGGGAPGTALSWKDATLFLLGWRVTGLLTQS